MPNSKSTPEPGASDSVTSSSEPSQTSFTPADVSGFLLIEEDEYTIYAENEAVGQCIIAALTPPKGRCFESIVESLFSLSHELTLSGKIKIIVFDQSTLASGHQSDIVFSANGICEIHLATAEMSSNVLLENFIYRISQACLDLKNLFVEAHNGISKHDEKHLLDQLNRDFQRYHEAHPDVDVSKDPFTQLIFGSRNYPLEKISEAHLYYSLKALCLSKATCEVIAPNYMRVFETYIYQEITEKLAPFLGAADEAYDVHVDSSSHANFDFFGNLYKEEFNVDNLKQIEVAGFKIYVENYQVGEIITEVLAEQEQHGWSSPLVRKIIDYAKQTSQEGTLRIKALAKTQVSESASGDFIPPRADGTGLIRLPAYDMAMLHEITAHETTHWALSLGNYHNPWHEGNRDHAQRLLETRAQDSLNYDREADENEFASPKDRLRRQAARYIFEFPDFYPEHQLLAEIICWSIQGIVATSETICEEIAPNFMRVLKEYVNVEMDRKLPKASIVHLNTTMNKPDLLKEQKPSSSKTGGVDKPSKSKAAQSVFHGTDVKAGLEPVTSTSPTSAASEASINTDLSQFSSVEVERLKIYVETAAIGEYIKREFPYDAFDDSINYVEGMHSLLTFSQQLNENSHLTIIAFNKVTLPSGHDCEVITKSKGNLEIHLAVTQENIATLHARLAYCMAKICLDFGGSSNTKLNPIMKLHLKELLKALKRAFNKYRRSANGEDTEKTAIAKLIFGSLEESPKELTQERICRTVQALALSYELCSAIASSYIEALIAYIETEVSLKEGLLVAGEEEIKPLDEQQRRERQDSLEDSNFDTDTFKKVEIKGITFWAENDNVIERLTEIFSMEEWLNSELLSKVVRYTQWLSLDGLTIKAYDSTEVKHFDAAPELGGALDKLGKSTALYHARFSDNGLSEVIKIPTRNTHTLFESYIHEATHLCVALAKSTMLISDQEKHHINHMIRMLYKDYQAYKVMPKRKRLKHESYVAQKIFHMPLQYPKDDFFVGLMAFSMQAVAVSEATFKRIAPNYYEAFKSYVNDELDPKLKMLDMFSKHKSKEIDDEDDVSDTTEDVLSPESLTEENDTLFDGASKADESTSQSLAEENNTLFDSVSEAEIIAGITVDYSQSSLNGSTVYHGTIDAHIDSIKAGPQNIGRGFGGAGLYVFLSDDHARAEEYAGFAGQSGGEKVVIEGQLNPNKDYRVARIQIVPRYQMSKVDYKKGLFPADWKNNTKLQALIHKHFDILEVCADIDEKSSSYVGYNLPSSRFLVIHERAGKDIINWTHTHPVRNTNFGSSTSSPTSSSIPSQPSAKSELPPSSSTMKHHVKPGTNTVPEYVHVRPRHANPANPKPAATNLGQAKHTPLSASSFHDDYELPEFPPQQKTSQAHTGKPIEGKTGIGESPDVPAGPSLPTVTPTPSTPAPSKALPDLSLKKPALPAPPVRKELPHLPGTSSSPSSSSTPKPPSQPKPGIEFLETKPRPEFAYVNGKPVKVEWVSEPPAKTSGLVPEQEAIAIDGHRKINWRQAGQALKYMSMEGLKYLGKGVINGLNVYAYYECFKDAHQHYESLGQQQGKSEQSYFALAAGTTNFRLQMQLFGRITMACPPVGALLIISSLAAKYDTTDEILSQLKIEHFNQPTSEEETYNLIHHGHPGGLCHGLTQEAMEELGPAVMQLSLPDEYYGAVAIGRITGMISHGITQGVYFLYDKLAGTPQANPGVVEGAIPQQTRLDDSSTSAVPDTSKPPFLQKPSIDNTLASTKKPVWGYVDGRRTLLEGEADPAIEQKLKDQLAPPIGVENPANPSYLQKDNHVLGTPFFQVGSSSAAAKDYLAISNLSRLGEQLGVHGHQQKETAHEEIVYVPHSTTESNNTHGAPSSCEKLHETTHQNNTVKPDEVTFHKTDNTVSTHEGIKKFAHQNFDPKQRVYDKLPPIGGYKPEKPISPVILTIAGGTGVPLTATLTATVKGFSVEACSTAFADAGAIINGIAWGELAGAMGVVLPFAAIIGGIIYNFQKRREENKREIIEEQREFVAREMSWALKECQKASTAIDAWMNAPDDGDKAKLFDKALKSLRKAIYAINKIETKYDHLLQDKDNGPKLDVVTRDPAVEAYKRATGKKDIPDTYYHSVHTVRKKTWKLIEEELPNLKSASSMMQGAVFFLLNQLCSNASVLYDKKFPHVESGLTGYQNGDIPLRKLNKNVSAYTEPMIDIILGYKGLLPFLPAGSPLIENVNELIRSSETALREIGDVVEKAIDVRLSHDSTLLVNQFRTKGISEEQFSQEAESLFENAERNRRVQRGNSTTDRFNAGMMSEAEFMQEMENLALPSSDSLRPLSCHDFIMSNISNVWVDEHNIKISEFSTHYQQYRTEKQNVEILREKYKKGEIDESTLQAAINLLGDKRKVLSELLEEIEKDPDPKMAPYLKIEVGDDAITGFKYEFTSDDTYYSNLISNTNIDIFNDHVDTINHIKDERKKAINELTKTYHEGGLSDEEYEKQCALIDEDALKGLEEVTNKITKSELCTDETKDSINKVKVSFSSTDDVQEEIILAALKQATDILSPEALKVLFAKFDVHWERIHEKEKHTGLLLRKANIAYKNKDFITVLDATSCVLSLKENDHNAFLLLIHAHRGLKTPKDEVLSIIDAYKSIFTETREQTINRYFEALVKEDPDELAKSYEEIKSLENPDERLNYMTDAYYAREKLIDNRRRLLMRIAHPDALGLLTIDRCLELFVGRVNKIDTLKNDITAIETLENKIATETDQSIKEGLINELNELIASTGKKEDLQEALKENETLRNHAAAQGGEQIHYEKNKGKIKTLLCINYGFFAADVIAFMFSERIKSKFKLTDRQWSLINETVSSSVGLINAAITNMMKSSVIPDSELSARSSLTPSQITHFHQANSEGIGSDSMQAAKELLSRFNVPMLALKVVTSFVALYLENNYKNDVKHFSRPPSFNEWLETHSNQRRLLQANTGIRHATDLFTHAQLLLSLHSIFMESLDPMALTRKVVNVFLGLSYVHQLIHWLMSDPNGEVSTHRGYVYFTLFIEHMKGDGLRHLLHTHEDTILGGVLDVFYRYLSKDMADKIHTKLPFIQNAIFMVRSFYAIFRMDSDVDSRVLDIKIGNFKKRMANVHALLKEAKTQEEKKDACHKAATMYCSMKYEIYCFSDAHPERRRLYIMALHYQHLLDETLELIPFNGDGNGLFKAVSEYTDESPKILREKSCDYIALHQAFFEGFHESFIEVEVEGKKELMQVPFADYLTELRKCNAQADSLVVRALTKILNRPIIILFEGMQLDFGKQGLKTNDRIKKGDPIFVYYDETSCTYHALHLRGELYFETQYQKKRESESPPSLPPEPKILTSKVFEPQLSRQAQQIKTFLDSMSNARRVVTPKPLPEASAVIEIPTSKSLSKPSTSTPMTSKAFDPHLKKQTRAIFSFFDRRNTGRNQSTESKKVIKPSFLPPII